MKLTLSQVVALTATNKEIEAHRQEIATHQKRVDELQETVTKLLDEAGLTDKTKQWRIAPDGTVTEALPQKIAERMTSEAAVNGQ